MTTWSARTPHTRTSRQRWAGYTEARTPLPRFVVREYCDHCVCLSVCLCLFVHNHIFATTRPIFTNFFCVLPTAVARSSSGGEVTRSVIPVSAEGRVQSGSADIQCPQHLNAVVPATRNPGSRTRPQPAIDHYDAVSTFHDDSICETRFSMLCASCLELTTENCSQ